MTGLYGLGATFKNVKKSIFDAVSDKIENDPELRDVVEVYYNGTNKSGDLTLDANQQYSEKFKKALKLAVEEYCNN